MNNSYKLIYSEALNAWVAVAEHVKGRGKKGTVRLLTAVTLMVGGIPGSGLAFAAPPVPLIVVNQLPTGAQVSAGAVSISQTQTAAVASMAISQTSNKAIVNWQSFNVGANAKVNITQPSSTSVLLNRVQTSDPSQIFGQIKANGQVFLTNPNGVYFAPGSSVDVGSFTATTHGISDADFLSGNYQFSRNGAAGSIVNQGSLTAGLGGYIALLAPEVRNQGVVVAQMGGTVALAAGESYQLLLNSNGQLTNVLVTPATIQTLVDNGNAVQAPGGLIILSAQAASGLLGGVVKNSGAISATGLVNDGGTIRLSASHKIELAQTSSIRADAAANSAGNGGRIDIIADLGNATGITQVDGTISAKGGEQGGDGGFVDTSAARLAIGETTLVTTGASMGNAGTWLLDPYDVIIAGPSGTASGTAYAAGFTAGATSTILASSISNSLNAGSNVTISTGTTANNQVGSITVNGPITWSTAQTLTLSANYNININAAISATATSGAGVALQYNQGNAGGTYGFGLSSSGFAGSINFGGNANTFTTKNHTDSATSYQVITTLGATTSTTAGELYGINGGLSGNYALGSNINAGGALNALATTAAPFTGKFEGLGHNITATSLSCVDRCGLFSNATDPVIQNLGLNLGTTNSGQFRGGALVGSLVAGTISNVFSNSSITASSATGGLIGYLTGGTLWLSNSYTTGTVGSTGSRWVGGLIGYGLGTAYIHNSYTTGSVGSSSATDVGGLVGYMAGGVISNSYATGNISTSATNADTTSVGTGGLIGTTTAASTVINSYSTGNISAPNGSNVGGVVGFNAGKVINTYASGSVTGTANKGGLIGKNSGTLAGSYWNTTTSGLAAGVGTGTIAGGTGLTSSQMQQQSNFAEFDFSQLPIWAMGTTGNLNPVLSGTLSNIFLGASGGSWSTADNWSLGSTPINSNGGITALINSGITVNYDTGAAGSLARSIYNAGTISFSGSTAVSLDGTISGSGALVNASTGIVTLNGNNTFLGGTTITSGILAAGSANALGAGAVSIGSSGKLDLTYSGTVVLGSSLSMSSGAAITNSANTSSLSVAGTSALAGTINTAGNQTYSGATSLGANTSITTLNTGLTNTNGAITFGSTVNSSTGNYYGLTVSNGTGTTAFGGVVGGTNPLAYLCINAASCTATSAGTASGSGTTTLAGDVTTSGSQTYGGNLTLGANTALTSTANNGNGAVTVAGAVSTAVAGSGYLYLEGLGYTDGTVTATSSTGVYKYGGTTYTLASGSSVTLAIGTLTYSGYSSTNYQTSYSFTPTSTFSSNYLIVAGGGSADTNGHGGGGGGGVVTNAYNGGRTLLSSASLTASNPYTIVIGDGGTSANGYNSVAFGYTAQGGGGSDNNDSGARSGGSSGGSRNNYNGVSTQYSTFGYGFGYGTATSNTCGCSWGVGGGGAGGISSATTASGGAAYQWIDGNYYAGGGGAGSNQGSTTTGGTTTHLGGGTAITAQKGGGGDGGLNANTPGSHGVNGTGGGAGGSAANLYAYSARTGGSGVVAFSYNAFGTYALTINSGSGKASVGGSLSNVSTLTINSTSALSEITGAIGGSTALVKSGAGGVLTLSGANTYTGGTTISGGTLKIGNAAALGGSGGAVSVASGAALDLNGITMTNTNALTLRGTGISDGGALTNSSSTAATYAGNVALGTASSIGSAAGDITASGVVSGAFALSKIGAATLTLTGSNTYTGGTNISAGILKAGHGGALGNSGGGAISVTSGASLDLNGFSLSNISTLTLNGAGISSVGALTNSSNTGTAISNPIVLGGDTSIGSSTANINLSGVISGAGNLTKIGTANSTLSGINTYTGTTTVSGGILALSNSQGLGSTDGGTIVSSSGRLLFNGLSLGAEAITVNGGSLEVQSGTSSLSGTVNLGANSSVRVDLGAQLTLSGVVSGTGRLIKNFITGGSPLNFGTLILTGTNTYSGGTTISAGTLQLGAGGTSGSISGDVINNATLAFNRSDDLTFAGAISGTGAVTNSAANTLTLSGNNTYSGGTTISAGTLKVGSPTALGTGASSVISGAALDLNGQTMTSTGMLTLRGTGISSTGALRNSGGTAATYAGLLTLGANSSIYTESVTSPISLTNTGTLVGGGFTLTLDGSTQSTDNHLHSVIDNTTAKIIKKGSFFWTLHGANTYSGGTEINGGTIRAGSPTALGSGPITVASGGSLDLRGQTMTSTGTLSLNGTGYFNLGALRNSNTTAATYAGPLVLAGNASVIAQTGAIQLTHTGTLTGATFGLTLGGAQGGSIAGIIGTTTGTLTKQDVGSWTLSGANTYTGATTISAGTLKLGSATAAGTGAISVGSGGALDLNGQTLTSTGALTLSGTGVASSGALVNSSGTAATYAGAVALASDSSYGGTGAITFGSTVNSASSAAYALSSTSGGNLVFDAAVGASYPLSSLTTGTGTTTLGANVTTVGAQTYGGPVVIKKSSGVTLANTNSAITFGATVDSISATSYALTLSNGTGATTFTGAIGATDAVGALTVNGTGPITLGGNVSTKGNQSYFGPVSIAAGVTLTANPLTGSSGIITNGNNNDSYYAFGVTGLTSSSITESNYYVVQSGSSSSPITSASTENLGIMFYNNTGTLNGAGASNNWCCINYPVLVDAGQSTLLSSLTVVTRGDGMANRVPTAVSVYGSNTPFTSANSFKANSNTFSNLSILGTGYQQSNFSLIGGSTLSFSGGGTASPTLSNTISFTNSATYRYYELVFNSASGATDGGMNLATGVSASYGLGLALNAINLYGAALTPSAIAFNQSATAIGALTVSTGSLTATAISAGGTLSISNSGAATVTGAISNNGANAASLVKSGAGTLTLSGTNTYTGGTTVSAGTLQVGAGSTTGSIVGNVTNNATLAFNRSDNLTFAGVISGTGAVSKSGANTLTFSGSNTYTGGTTLSAGTLQLGDGSTSGAIAGNVANNATLVFNRSDDVTYAGVISGTGALTQSGAGTTTLSGANTYTGATTVSAGTLAIAHATGLGTTAGGVTVASGATLDMQGATVGAEAIALNGGTLATTTGTSSLSGAVTLGADSTINVAGASSQLTLSGLVTGARALTKSGTGNLILSRQNTFSGGLTIAAGTATEGTTYNGTSGPFGSGTVTVQTGATLDLNNYNVYAPVTLAGGALVNNATSGGIGQGDVSLGVSLTADSIFGGAGYMNAFTAIASNGYGLVFLGTGRKNLSNVNNTLTSIASGSGVGVLSVVNNQALTIGQVTVGGNTYSGISSTGTVSVETRTGDLTLSQNVATTSTASNYSTPALRLGAGSLAAAGTPAGGDVVLSGTPTMSVGAGGVALIYSGYMTTSAARTLWSSLSTKPARYYTSNADRSRVPTSAVTGYIALYRESPITLYTLYLPNQRFTYGTPITSLDYCYSSSASSCVPVTATGIPSSTQATAMNNLVLPAGTYPGTISPDPLPVTGYLFAAGNAVNVIVDPKQVTIANTARTTRYNGTSTYSDLANAMAYTVTGLVGLDAVGSVTQTPSGNGLVAGNVANAGSFTVTPSAPVLSIGTAGNYTFSYTAAMATVNKADLKVTVNNDARFVGESDQAAYNGVRYEGFVAGQTAAVLSGNLAIARSNASVGAAGTYAGVLSAAASTLSSNNYNITYVPGSYTIVPADQLLIRLADASTTYGTAPSYTLSSVQYKSSTGNTVVDLTSRAAISVGTFTLTDGAGGNTALTLGPLSGSVSSAGQVAAGSYQVGATGITNTSANYSDTVNIVGALTVAPKSLTVAATSGLSKSYDGNTSMGSLGLGLSGVVGVDAVTASGLGSYANASAGNGKALTVSGITLAGTDAANYKLATNTLSASIGVITAAPLLITAKNDSKTYDATAYAASAGVSYSGFVNGESSADLGGALTYGGSAIGAVNAGSYVITPGGQTSNNYAITFGNGALNISPADVRVSATNVSLTGTVAKVYDGTNVATLTPGNYVTTGWLGSDGATITQTTGIYDNANAGSNKLVSVTLASSDYSPTNGTVLSNYNLPTTASGYVGVIAPKTVTVTNAARSTTYDGASTYVTLATGTTYSVGTMVGSDAVASVTQTPTGFNGGAAGTAQAGAYTITPSAAVLGSGTASNYNFVYVDSTHTVNKANATVTANSGTVNYNGANQSVTGFTASGLVGGETESVLTGVSASRTAKNAGTYAVVASGTDSNYNLSFADGSLTISPAGVSAIVASLTGSTSKTYDGNTSATLTPGNFALTGFAPGEGASVSKTTGTFDNANAGTGKTVTASLASSDFAATGGTLLSNYTLPNSASGSIGTITPAPLTVSATSASKTYDGTGFSGGNGVTYSGFVNSETAAVLGGSLNYTGTSQGARNAGSYVITPAGLTSSNYAVSFANGTLTVTPAPMTLTAVTNSKSFDGNIGAQGLPTVDGLKGSDRVTNLSEVYSDANPGNGKKLTVSSTYVIQDGNGGLNYAVTLVPDTSGVIRALPLVVLPPSTAELTSPTGVPVEPIKTLDVSAMTQGVSKSILNNTTNAASVNASSAVAESASSNLNSSSVIVSLVSPATQQTPGLVTVLVPVGTSNSRSGLSISLPESLFAGAAQVANVAQVTLPDQRPLPAWIRYDAVNKTLLTGAVPEGAFPITVWVTVGTQVTVVEISETQAKL